MEYIYLVIEVSQTCLSFTKVLFFVFAAIILSVILGILLLILLALYKRIAIAIQIIKEGSRLANLFS